MRATIELVHDLGLLAVAEDIEYEATLVRLRPLGCDQAQGYLISRPLPARTLESRLMQRDEGLTAVDASLSQQR